MSANAILSLIEELQTLKRISRAGWRIRGIRDAESVADHCFRMATLAMILADYLVETGVELDANKVTRMALVHEFGEARIGDIPFPAMRHIDNETKFEAELDAVDTIVSPLGEIGKAYKKLWDEFETGETIEAKLVRAADKLEMMIQVEEYEQVGYQCLDDFWANPVARLNFDQFPVVAEIMDTLQKRHDERKK